MRRYLARLAAAAKSTDYRTAAAASKTIAAKDTSAASKPAAAVGMIANTLSATSSVGSIKLVVKLLFKLVRSVWFALPPFIIY